MIVVSIGANNFGFSDAVSKCIAAYQLESDCSKDPEVTGIFNSSRQREVANQVAEGLGRVEEAMRNAGYSQNNYRIVIQTYPSPIPMGSGFRYPQDGYGRETSGCALRNNDADWANRVALPAVNNAVQEGVKGAKRIFRVGNIDTLNVTDLFNGNRLCEKSANTLEEWMNQSNNWRLDWKSPGARQAMEWVTSIRTATAIASPEVKIQESLHPNYFGQQMLQACTLRAFDAYYTGVRSGNSNSSAAGRCTANRPQTTEFPSVRFTS